MIIKPLVVIALFCLVALAANAASYYASPSGSGSGSGEMGSPWDISTAMGDNSSPTSSNTVVQGGDTIWLRGGTYGVGSNVFTCSLVGTSNAPVVVRQYPGERAIIDGGINANSGSWITFWGFEITCSNERTNIFANRPTGLSMDGVGQKAINLVIYNTGHPGIGSFQNEGTGREIYGCIIWGTGIYEYGISTYTPTNPLTRGAGMYLQNRYNTFTVADNISSRNFTEGIKPYGESGYVNGFIVDGNITFKNETAGILIECLGNSISNATVVNNVDYRSFKNTMGYFSDTVHAVHYGLLYSNNYQTTYPDYRQSALWLKRWQNVNVVGNTIATTSFSNEWVTATSATPPLGGSGNFVEIFPITNSMSYAINNNVYHGGVELTEPYEPFRYQIYEPELTFATWTNTYGFDLNSSYTTNLPTANVVAIRTNKYEIGRAHIAVYNWQSNSTANVNLSGVGLTHGQRFEVRDAQDFLGTPILTTNYNASSPAIDISLLNTNVTSVTGGIEGNFVFNPNVHTAPLFNAFVILPLTQAVGSATANSATVGRISVR